MEIKCERFILEPFAEPMLVQLNAFLKKNGIRRDDIISIQEYVIKLEEGNRPCITLYYAVGED